MAVPIMEFNRIIFYAATVFLRDFIKRYGTNQGDYRVLARVYSGYSGEKENNFFPNSIFVPNYWQRSILIDILVLEL